MHEIPNIATATRDRLEGIVPVIPTPFVPVSEEVDYAALRALIDFAAGQDVAAICLPAYGSEYYKLAETERHNIIATATERANARIPVMAQSNHPSARVAATIARRNVELGANIVSFALPRLFPLSESDLMTYAQTVCDAVDVPVLIQDFNPGGATIGADFCVRLHEASPNFRYVKLEEPMMGAKVQAIRRATADRVGVFEGWGGLYVLELLPSGICGLMPGLGVADLLAKVWRLGKEERIDEAFDVFQAILPQIVFGINNMELFVLLEKQLLVERGILRHAVTRCAGLSLSAELAVYAERVNRRVLRVLSMVEAPA